MILHLIHIDKFIPPFIDFMEEHFTDFERHLFLILENNSEYPVRKRLNTVFFNDFGKYRKYIELIRYMNLAEKIILHGLFIDRVVQLLSMQPWLLKKCYWVIWGGDLYSYKVSKRTVGWRKDEIFRRIVIKRIGNLVTYVEGDVDLAREWYGARGKYHECLMYPSNLYKEYSVPPKTDDVINIQIGNSADPSNEHFEILEMLERYKDNNIKIYAPLSYGDHEYALQVVDGGKRIFGEKFIPLLDFIPFSGYLKFLGEIDIAIFNHRRQQAMGNTITLLGLGKKVYMRRDVTPFSMFESIGVKLYDKNLLTISLGDADAMLSNVGIIKKCFSETRLKLQLTNIFVRS